MVTATIRPREFTQKQIDRLWSRVDRSDGPSAHWLWLGGTSQWGRPRINLYKRNYNVPCLLWEWEHGPVPDSARLVATCGDKKCVKPDHQEVVALVFECSVDECSAQPKGRGWCSTHYRRWQRTGTVELHPQPLPQEVEFFNRLSTNGQRFRSLQGVSDVTGASKDTVRRWARNEFPPRWRHIIALADRFDRNPIELALQLWNDKLGDPCPCGCGGTQVLFAACGCNRGDHDGLTRFPTSQPCVDCGAERFHHYNNPSYQSCRSCKYGNRRTLEYTCVGYDFFGRVRHAKTCERSKMMPPGDITASRRAQERSTSKRFGKGLFKPGKWDRWFADPETQTYRCGACSLGSMSLAARKEQVKIVTAERIRTPADLREAQSARHTMWWADNPDHAAKIANRRRPPLSPEGRRSLSRGMILSNWSGTTEADLPNIIARPCYTCHTLILYPESGAERLKTGMPRCHRGCRKGSRWAYQRRLGRPRRDDLRRDFAWALQHHVGGMSLRQIARNWDKDVGAVKRAVDAIMLMLPSPNIVQGKFRLHIELLWEARGNDALSAG